MIALAFFDTIRVIEVKEKEMKKYNVKLMNNKKGYLNSFKNELGEKFIFIGFKEERNNFKSEFTKEEMKDTWNLLKRSKVCV